MVTVSLVKKEAGIFEDPFLENIETVKTETGSDEYRAVAKQLVEESLVLVKNKGGVLPLKEGSRVYITGPAMDNAQAQCGGWTIDWNQSPLEDIEGVTTILDGFEEVAEEKGITVTTDPEEAEDADVVLLVVGEKAYAEWNGDTPDLELTGALGLDGNKKAIKEAEDLKKKKIPVVTLIVAGRNVLIGEYEKNWDAIVMCYLPGSEGDGVAEVVCGNADFRGKLPSPWYSSLEEIGTEECMYPMGYGLNY